MKCKKTVNVKKFISILLCTIFMSSILPSNLLNCTVFAADNTYKKEQIFDGKDLIYKVYKKSTKFSRICNKIDDTEKDLAQGDYKIEENEEMFTVTIKKEYITTLPKDKRYTLYCCSKPFEDLELETKAEMQMYVPKEVDCPICLIEPKYIDYNSNGDESKIYLNSTTDKGLKTIVAHGKPNSTIKIKIKTQENDKVIGSGTISKDTVKCDIKLNDEFNKLENGKEYPVSIYECTSSETNSSETNSSETNSSETKKLDATFFILNTPPTIKFLDNNGVEIQANYQLSTSSLNGLKIEATDALKNKIEQGNLEVFVKEKEKATEEELNNNGNWRPCNNLQVLIKEKGTDKKTIYVYAKAKDKAGNISYKINDFKCLFYTPTTTQ